MWLNPDHTLGPDEGLDLDDGEDFAMRVMESKPHLLKDNPLLRELESTAVFCMQLELDKVTSLYHLNLWPGGWEENGT